MTPEQPVKDITNKGCTSTTIQILTWSLCGDDIAPCASLQGVNTGAGLIIDSSRGHQDHLVGAQVAAAMHVAMVTSSAEHRALDTALDELWRSDQAKILAGDGVAHKDLFIRPVFVEKATVTAIEQIVTEDAATAWRIESLRGDAVGRVEDGFEHHPVVADHEDAE